MGERHAFGLEYLFWVKEITDSNQTIYWENQIHIIIKYTIRYIKKISWVCLYFDFFKERISEIIIQVNSFAFVFSGIGGAQIKNNKMLL